MERHDTVLIACADMEDRRHLRFVLDERFNLLEAVNLQQMLLLLEQNHECIAAVVLTTSVLEEGMIRSVHTEKTDEILHSVPIIVVTEEGFHDDLERFFRWGASDVIPVDYDPYAMLRRMETIVQLYLHKQHLETVVEEQADQLRRSNDHMVDILTSIIEYRSMESGHHILRIRYFTRILMEEVMRQCPEYGITDRLVTIVASASALHDIGKIAIPDAILTKPGPLTRQEWEVMQTHAVTGCQILDTLGSMADQEYLRYAHNICHYHHERWDGTGYPEGLAGDQIPICAQVVGLADAYEALTSKRVYKDACSFVEAVNMILQGECGAFSPQLLECFKNVTRSFAALTEEYADGRPSEDSPFDMTLPPPKAVDEGDGIDRTRAKYYALVHYIGAFLLEVNLDRSLFHVVYNPYPELANLEGISTLGQLIDLMLEKIVVPEERERMRQVIFEEIPRFVDEDLRRVSYQFNHLARGAMPGGRFEMTLLRINAHNNARSLAILFRKLPGGVQVKEPERYVSLECTYVCRNDRDFSLVEIGQGSAALGGYTVEELQKGLEGRLSQVIHPEDREMVREEFNRQLKNSTQVRLEHRVCLKDGRIMWVTNRSHLVMSGDGQELLYCYLTDITETRSAFAALQERHQQYAQILTQTQTVLFIWDVGNDTVTCSDTWKELFAFTPPREDLHNRLARSSHIHPDDIPLILDRISDLRGGANQATAEVRISNDRGRYVWCRFRANASRGEDGTLQKVLGVIANVDTEKQEEQMLVDRAERDGLTKLLNKAAGRKKAETYLSYYPNGVRCAMIVIDLDNFKQVNDQNGHLFGDAVLTRVAQEIKGQFKGQDIVCRIGGDEFLVLVRGLSDRNVLQRRCQQLIASLGRSLKAQAPNLPLSCSAGIALCPEHGGTYYELFNAADKALYQAKSQGKNCFCFYEPKESGFLTEGSRATGTRIDSDKEPVADPGDLVRHAFQLLYRAEDVPAAINEVIAFLGKKLDVSRVYVFENSDDNRFCSNTFEWCNEGILPEMEQLQNLSYERDIPGYDELFDEDGLFYCQDVEFLASPAREIVMAQGIKSMLQCAIRQNGRFRDYIGFDECNRQRLWTKEEIKMLTYFSEILSLCLLNYREHEKVERQAQELRSILDNQNTWIYIIDPDTWKLNYVNKRAREILPGAKSGDICYRCIRGLDAPCPGCPSLDIREKRTERRIVPGYGPGEELLTEATMVSWEGREQCMMTCRLLPKRHDTDPAGGEGK